MIPWLQIDIARVPGAEVELRLMRRGTEFSMMLGPNELMNSRLSGSEEALATLACRRLAAVKAPHLLIGGLGMGFTLRAALAVLGADARITVAELVPAVIAWAKGPMASIFGDSLADPRVASKHGERGTEREAHAQSADQQLRPLDRPQPLAGERGQRLLRSAEPAVHQFVRTQHHREFSAPSHQAKLDLCAGHARRIDLQPWNHAKLLSRFRAKWIPVRAKKRVKARHCSIGQFPGWSQGAGVGRVVAETSAEGGLSVPLTTTEMRQR